MIEKRIMSGFSNIHVAKFVGNGYGIPVAIEGAVSVNIELNFEYETASSGSGFIQFGAYKGGSGTLSVLGLTVEEFNLLFGHRVENDLVTVKTTDTNSPKLALMFSKEKLDGTQQNYCIYDIRCKPLGIDASTLRGAFEEESTDIELFVGSTFDKIYYTDNNEDESFFDSVKI